MRFAAVVRAAASPACSSIPERSAAVGARLLRNFLSGDLRACGMSFTVYPALDIRAGRVVRLRQGDYARETATS